MREIGSEEQIKKKSRRNAVIISIFMLGIMVISSAGYAFITGVENNQDSGENNEKIQRVGDYWIFDFQGQTIRLSNAPEDVKNISVSLSSQINIEKYKAKPLYIASENNGVAYEIASSLGNFAPRAQYACYGNCTKDLPSKDCYDNLIVWRESELNRVYQENSCVFIDGDLKAADAFLYKMFGMN